MICSEQASKEMKIFERENLFIKGGIFVYCTVVFLFMKLKLTHDKCDSSDVLIKLSLLSNIKKVYFLRYKRYLNRLCTFSRCLDTVNVQSYMH